MVEVVVVVVAAAGEVEVVEQNSMTLDMMVRNLVECMVVHTSASLVEVGVAVDSKVEEELVVASD